MILINKQTAVKQQNSTVSPAANISSWKQHIFQLYVNMAVCADSKAEWVLCSISIFHEQQKFKPIT
jgi:hypothetical protein